MFEILMLIGFMHIKITYLSPPSLPYLSFFDVLYSCVAFGVALS